MRSNCAFRCSIDLISWSKTSEFLISNKLYVKFDMLAVVGSEAIYIRDVSVMFLCVYTLLSMTLGWVVSIRPSVIIERLNDCYSRTSIPARLS